MVKKKPELEAPGHVLLSFFNIDYHSYIEPITEVLMENPDKNFKLTLERVTKKTKAAKYIQPKTYDEEKVG